MKISFPCARAAERGLGDGRRDNDVLVLGQGASGDHDGPAPGQGAAEAGDDRVLGEPAHHHHVPIVSVLNWFRSSGRCQGRAPSGR